MHKVGDKYLFSFYDVRRADIVSSRLFFDCVLLFMLSLFIYQLLFYIAGDGSDGSVGRCSESYKKLSFVARFTEKIQLSSYLN